MSVRKKFEGSEHTFERVCELAESKHWCWKIGCTTCGAMHLRTALAMIAAGDALPRIKRDLGHFGRAIEPECRAMAGFGDWSSDDAIRLRRALLGSRADRIVRASRFPNGLGYLGMALFCSGSAAREVPELEQQWALQLETLVPAHSIVAEKLRAIARGDMTKSLDGLLEEIESEMQWRGRQGALGAADDDLSSQTGA